MACFVYFIASMIKETVMYISEELLPGSIEKEI